MSRAVFDEASRMHGLWHVHTDRTDGRHSVAELITFADDNDFPLIAIAEHVRRDLSYDFDALYSEAKTLADGLAVTCLVGCEAKVIDEEGTLDVSAATVDRADIVYAAYHGTSFSTDAYLSSIPAMLADPIVDVWAHPFDYLSRLEDQIRPAQRDRILAAVRTNDVLFELNLRRPAPPVVQWGDLRGIQKIIGYDLHDLTEWESGGRTPRVSRQ